MASGTRASEVGRGLKGLLEGTHGFLFILAAISATGGLLAGTPQGKDLVVTTVQDGESQLTGQLVWLCITTFLVGFQAWFWARAIVEHQLGDRGVWGARPFLVWAPRVLGLLPFGFLLLALLTCGQPPSWADWALTILALALLGFIIARQALIRSIRDKARRLQATGRGAAGRAMETALDRLKPIVMGIGLAVAAAMTVLFTVDPVHPAQLLGPAGVLLLATALIIPVMTVLIQLGRSIGVRTTESLIIIASVFSLWVDNHAVRLLPGAAATRPSVLDAYQDWRAKTPPLADGSRPIVFVASAGGASRAGYWAGLVLSQLQKMSGGAFSRRLFAISSISGGSLGSVGFLAALKDHEPLESLPEGASAFLGKDYLSPAFAGGAYPDVLQRVLPIAFLPDRAQTIERGWEAGWTQHCGVVRCSDEHLLERGFLSLWSDHTTWMPVLMIGGASEEGGQRILTSNVTFDGFVDAEDFHVATGRDVRLSTAILNGARFPYISPGGTMFRTGERPEHIVDGGYFDAAGVETVRELAQGLMAKAPAADHLKPVYLILVNGDPPPHEVRPANFGADIFGPLKGLYASQGAHGALLRSILLEYPPLPAGAAPPPPVAPAASDLCNPDRTALPANVILVCLCHKGAPMDWALSAPAQQLMTGFLGGPGRDPCGNYAKLTALVKLVGGQPG